MTGELLNVTAKADTSRMAIEILLALLITVI
jgi:hypothetical protein